MIAGIVAGARRAAGLPSVTHPYWGNVVSLLHLDGSLHDEKGHVWTAPAGISFPSGSPFGSGKSISFPTTSSTVRTPDSVDFDFGVGDFTVEFRLNVATVTNWATYIDKRASGSVLAPFLIQRNGTTGNIRALCSFNGSTWGVTLNGAHPPLSTWAHIALTRRGSVFRLFVGGSLAASQTASTAALFKNTADLTICGNASATEGFVGLMHELCITKGVSLYNEPFTPPAGQYRQ